MPVLQALLLLILILGSLAEESLRCGQGYTDENEGICYAYIAKEGTRQAAQSHCAKLGGYLAEPRTKEQNRFVMILYKKYHPEIVFNPYLYLGGKEKKEKKWKWDSDDESIPLRGEDGFYDWGGGEPGEKQGIGGNCLFFYGSETEYNQFWTSQDCAAGSCCNFICQTAPPTTTTITATTSTSTTPSINNDVMIGVVAGVVGLLLVASVVMMYLYFGKKRQEEEQQKMAKETERERADMDMEMAEVERQLQLEQQRAMEMEGHYSASMESLSREVESLRMKDIEQQQTEKKPETGLVQQISSLVFRQPEEPAQGQSSSRHSVQQSRSRVGGQDRQTRRLSRHSPSHLSAQHPGRGQSPSNLTVDPSETTYDPHRF